MEPRCETEFIVQREPGCETEFIVLREPGCETEFIVLREPGCETKCVEGVWSTHAVSPAPTGGPGSLSTEQ